ncbi:MAG: hypothetical protein HQ522_07685 [Bacteroidetes bacterium]|nr:hypothetical protein [Bacteroidota bacterium]
MKVRVNKLIFALIIALSFIANSCTDLTVENLNDPTLLKVFSTKQDLQNYAGGTFRTLHNAMQGYESPASAMAVGADQNTCPWGYAYVYQFSSEPRAPFVNRTDYPYIYAIQGFWEDCYDAISSVNDVLKVMENSEAEINFEDSEINLLKAWSYFVSGVAHGYLGLTFDQANVVRGDPKTDSLNFAPWQTIIDVSLELLDQAILIADGNSFTIPAEWMGEETYTNYELSALANSYAARILAYSSRNKAHNENIDWEKVLKYVSHGIQKDLSPELGDNYDFYDMFTMYSTYPGWARIDHRIINLMDPNYPSYWPQTYVWQNQRLLLWLTLNGQDPGPAESEDARLKSDFEYLQENSFPPDRGFYHFSHYRYKRYDAVFSGVWYGNAPKPSMLVWENEILKAEALIRTGNINGAVSILNDPNGARKVRGQLPDITSTNPSEVLWIIFYERDIELINTGMGISYFDMRRRDMLQRGTILHFPVPAKELQIMNYEVYTIGGTPDGENVSNGSWTGLDGITVPPGIM